MVLKAIYSRQFVDSHPDSEDVAGEVSVEQAIAAFNEFPWSQQLEKVKNREMSSTLPSIFFKCEDGRELGVWTTNLEHFELYYCNKTHESFFTLSRDVTQNVEGLFVEDFISWFFTAEIESKLKLTRKRKFRKPEKDIQLEFRVKSYLTHFIPVLIWLPIHLMLIQIEFDTITSTVISNVIVGSCWLFPIILYVQYYNVNHKSSLTTSENRNTLIYTDSRKTIEFDPVDIKYYQYVKTRSSLAPWSLNEYIRFELKDDDNIILTCLLGEIEEFLISTRVNYKEIRKIVPLILKS